jgi:hypothetical protein
MFAPLLIAVLAMIFLIIFLLIEEYKESPDDDQGDGYTVVLIVT